LGGCFGLTEGPSDYYYLTQVQNFQEEASLGSIWKEARDIASQYGRTVLIVKPLVQEVPVECRPE